MAPTSVLGAILFLSVLLPGFAWLWTSERRGPMTIRPPTVAIAELAVVGTLAAALVFALVALGGTRVGWLFDVSAWLRAPDATVYFANHFWQALASFGVQIVGGTAVAAGAATMARKRGNTVFDPGTTVLHQVMETDRVSSEREKEVDARQSAPAVVALTMTDGTVVQGYLRCFPADRTESFLAVESPIFMSRQDGAGGRVKQPADAVVVNLHEVLHIAVQYGTAAPDAPQPPS